MIRKGYYSFEHCGHTVELTEYNGGHGYGISWFIAIDNESTGLEPKALRRDAKMAAIAHISHMQIQYHCCR